MLAGLEVQKFDFPANISRRERMLAVGSGVGDPSRSLGFQVRWLWQEGGGAVVGSVSEL